MTVARPISWPLSIDASRKAPTRLLLSSSRCRNYANATPTLTIGLHLSLSARFPPFEAPPNFLCSSYIFSPPAHPYVQVGEVEAAQPGWGGAENLTFGGIGNATFFTGRMG